MEKNFQRKKRILKTSCSRNLGHFTLKIKNKPFQVLYTFVQPHNLLFFQVLCNTSFFKRNLNNT